MMIRVKHLLLYLLYLISGCIRELPQISAASSSSFCNTVSEECRMDKNAVSARVSHPATVFPAYSCVTRNAKDKEVHVINTHEGFGSQRNINELPTVVGKIKLHVTRLPSGVALPVVLVLTSYEAISWEISTDEGIHIQEVNMVSSFAEQSGVTLNQSPTATINKEKRYFGFGKCSHCYDTLLAYVTGHYGLVTSFTGVFSVNYSDTWNLATGISGTCDDNYDSLNDTCSGQFDGYYPNPRNCSRFVKCQGGNVHPMVCGQNTRWSQKKLACLTPGNVECVQTTAPPPNQPLDEVDVCLRSHRCWVEHKFRYDNSWNECSGKQYISRTQHPEVPFLGVVLCNNNRYKLFLSSAPWEEFLNIADSSGHGADHCELVGGTEGKASLPINYWDSPITIGYYRDHWGDSFQKGPIGHGPHNGSEWTGQLYTTWYQCGIQIPGNFHVLPVIDFPRSTTTSSSATPRTTPKIPATTTKPSTSTIPMCDIGFIIKPTDIVTVDGDNMDTLFSCATNQSEGVSIRWLKNGKPIPGDDEVKMSDNKLYTSDGEVTLIHAGEYTCEAQRDNGPCKTRASGMLRVQPTKQLSLECGRPVQPLPIAKQGLNKSGSDKRMRTQPWMAHLCHSDGDCFCGGVLISSRYVLTAAHCLINVDYRTLKIKLGSYNQLDDEEEGQLTVHPDLDFTRHPQYDKETFDNDIALIHLHISITYNPQIRPICLESEGFLNKHFHSIRNNTGVVAGWGLLATGGKPKYLKEAKLPLHNHATCKKATVKKVTHNMFCAGYKSFVKGSDCKGDSGGPFTMKHDNVWYLVGLVSWGDNTRCSSTYGYYTKMANYYTWLVREVGVLY